ncbi:uncharacterized protein EMH_0072370 [Eimeria mitis]|uniref:Uncharacterized protein n=1 Tax=Eimeria mitis TaxID=44415 RepID=U6K522_9EIME|nr:uncharacterized protein EMH_0072370 [Eimeria mitis]CDJ32091.1 hypothetical protein, conserved [Eimeria mitis]
MQVASGPPPGTHAFDRHLSPLSNALGKYADPKTARAGRHPSSTCRICAGLLSVLAVVAVTLKFFRFCYDLGGRGDLSRRLAGREPAPEEDLDLSTIIEMCLDMEEEISVGPQTAAVPPEGQWERHSSWQLLTPYQQSQQTIPAVPSSAEWGSFQQSEGGQFFEPTPISLVQGDYDQGWPHSVEEAHQMPLEGPSELWQGSSVLPPYSGSPFTTANEGSTSTAPPWPTSAPSQFQNLGLGRC